MKIKKIIANNLYMIKCLLDIQASAIVGIIFVSVITTLIPVICNVVLLRYIINKLIIGNSLNKIFLVTIVVCVYILLTLIFSSLFKEYILPGAKERICSSILNRVNDKAVSLDISCYDNPLYYDELVWNMSAIEEKIDVIFDYLSKFPGYVANFILTSTVFTIIDKKLVILVLFTVFVTFIFNKPLAEANFNKENAIKSMRRKKQYIESVFKQYDYAQEIRLSNISSVLKREYNKNTKELQDVYRMKNKKVWIINFLQVFLSGYFMVNFVIVIYLGYQIIVKKNLNTGDFIAVFNGVNTLLSALYYLLGRFVTQIMESGYFIEKYRNFLSIEPSIKSGKKTINNGFQTLEFKNVSFSYNSKEEVLHRINFTIKRGEKIAIVGENGVGKSTLIKLVMRLYDVSAGQILLNGIDIREYDLVQYRKLMGVAFQNFQIYAAALGNNISGSVNYAPDRVMNVAKECGLYEIINKCVNGLETQMTKEFDDNGVILSGGEQQKIALARALYSNSELLILDEPSAALDPIAEQKLNKQLKNISNEKTVIYISHRLSSTVDADCIYVISNGQIVENGNHFKLLQKNGLYNKMWNFQAAKYVSNMGE